MLIAQIHERNAERFPNRPAIIDGDIRISFSDYANGVRRLADVFRSLGAQHQDRIAILSMNNWQYLEAYGACEHGGYILTTLNFRLAATELAYILNDSQPCIVVYEAQYANTITILRQQLPAGIRYLCLDAEDADDASYETLMNDADPERIPFSAQPDDVLSLIYTSGTTGRPKGVRHTQGGMAKLAERLAIDTGYTDQSRALLTMPLFHMGARGMQLGQHWSGGSCVVLRRWSVPHCLQLLQAEQITHVHFAPTMFQELLDHAQCDHTDLSALRMISYAAAPMPLPLLRRGIRKFGRIFLQMYGATECHATVFYQHQHNPDGDEYDLRRLGSVGQPCEQTEIKILDEQGDECAVGVAGEIAVRAPWCMDGYWNNPSATAEAMRNDWIMMGDIGYLDAQQFLYLVDRKKDMIISKGENIYSREVEIALLEHPEVSEAAVIGVPDSEWGEAVLGVVVPKAQPGPDDAQLIAWCRQHIAGYKCPKAVVFVDELPKLVTGKVDKKALRLQFPSLNQIRTDHHGNDGN